MTFDWFGLIRFEGQPLATRRRSWQFYWYSGPPFWSLLLRYSWKYYLLWNALLELWVWFDARSSDLIFVKLSLCLFILIRILFKDLKCWTRALEIEVIFYQDRPAAQKSQKSLYQFALDSTYERSAGRTGSETTVGWWMVGFRSFNCRIFTMGFISIAILPSACLRAWHALLPTLAPTQISGQIFDGFWYASLIHLHSHGACRIEGI